MSLSSFTAIVPIACVVAAALAAMVAEAFREPGERMPIAPLGAIGLIGAGASALLLWNRNASSFDLVVADNFGLFVTMVLVLVGIISLGISAYTVGRDGLPQGEYYALLLFALAGMMLMATATDLLLIFLALEVLSLAVYVLTGIRRESPAAVEAALKYFLLGAFSSAFFLYGIALTYGLTGTTRLDRIGVLMASRSLDPEPMQLVALGLLLVGFAFKVSAIPFHMWTPDAYEGAPTVVTGFMSTGVKAAAFAAFARVFLSALEPLHPQWRALVWAIAMATMIGATLAGVTQSSVKRLLAYSSIAHAGYLLVALVAANDVGKEAVLFYLLAYAVTNLGAFGVVAVLETPDRSFDKISDFAGLWNERPGLAGLMTMFLLSLGGFPPFAGFIAKWYVFSAAVRAGENWLAIVGVLSSVVSVFFYLRIVVMMYMTPADRPAGTAQVPMVAGLALIASAIAVFYLGILPARVIEWASASIATIF
jgi:NADH-quinone oxidoreductase subunit N